MRVVLVVALRRARPDGSPRRRGHDPSAPPLAPVPGPEGRRPGVSGGRGGVVPGRGRGTESHLSGTHRSGRSCGGCGRRGVRAGRPACRGCGPGVDDDVDDGAGLLTAIGGSHAVHGRSACRPPA